MALCLASVGRPLVMIWCVLIRNVTLGPSPNPLKQLAEKYAKMSSSAGRCPCVALVAPAWCLSPLRRMASRWESYQARSCRSERISYAFWISLNRWSASSKLSWFLSAGGTSAGVGEKQRHGTNGLHTLTDKAKGSCV